MDESQQRRRVNRTAAQRRQQYNRAHARQVQSLLKAFKDLNHRGCQLSKLGRALVTVLAEDTPEQSSAEQAAPAPASPPPDVQPASSSTGLSAAAPEFIPGNTAELDKSFERGAPFLQLPQFQPAIRPSVSAEAIPTRITSTTPASTPVLSTVPTGGDLVRRRIRGKTPPPTPDFRVSHFGQDQFAASPESGHSWSVSSHEDSSKAAETTEALDMTCIEPQHLEYMRAVGYTDRQISDSYAESAMGQAASSSASGSVPRVEASGAASQPVSSPASGSAQSVTDPSRVVVEKILAQIEPELLAYMRAAGLTDKQIIDNCWKPNRP